jgi:hypothetical protein
MCRPHSLLEGSLFHRWQGGLFLQPQRSGGSAELSGPFEVVFCAVEGSHPLQTPGGIGGIAKSAIEPKTFLVACPGQWVVLLRASQVPQQGQRSGYPPEESRRACLAESLFQQHPGPLQITLQPCALGEVEASKAQGSAVP